MEAIQKHELDMISLGNQYIMKSHKGEIEIDKDDFIKSKERGKQFILYVWITIILINIKNVFS